jgi:hypothetical protein
MLHSTSLAHLLTLIASLSYLAAALRLVSYRRADTKHRPWVSGLAVLVIAASLCTAVDLLLYQPRISPPHAVLAVIFCLLIYRVRGNLAHLLSVQK